MSSLGSTPRHRSSATNSTSASSRTVSLPEYQPPVAPLNQEAQRALSNLLQQTQDLRRLKVHLQHASSALTDSAGAVNDRSSEVRARYERRKDRGGDEFDQDGQQLKETEAFEKKVEDLTAGLEGQMRATIDGGAWIEHANDIVQAASQQVGSQIAPQTQPSTQRSRRGRRAVSDDEEEDENVIDSNPPESQSQTPVHAPSRLLSEGLRKRKADWDATSMTDRYAMNNAYIGFYRIVHDARHPGDEAPPVPHASTWFAEDENAAATAATSRHKRRGRQEADSDDDVEIARERISIRCPITLLPFKEPLTSTKCPHSFEQTAILEMIQNSSLRGPPPPSSQSQGRRVPQDDKAVKCPVCDLLLTANDLVPDPVLLRKVKRIEAQAEREERGNQSEDEDGQDSGNQVPRGTQRSAPEMLESSDVEGAPARRQRRAPSAPVRPKKERASGVVVPSSQQGDRGASAVPATQMQDDEDDGDHDESDEADSEAPSDED